MNLKIITDSCCDLPLSYVEANSDLLVVLGMPIQLEGKEIIDDLGKTFDRDLFYSKLRQGIMPTTSQINAFRFETAFREALDEHKEVIYLGFTSGMSGTINSATLAKQLVLDDMPDAKIQIVDTLSASIGQGAIVVEAIKLARAGQFAMTIKSSALLAYMATDEFLNAIQTVQSISFRYPEGFIIVTAGYLALTIPLIMLVRTLEKKLNYKVSHEFED